MEIIVGVVAVALLFILLIVFTIFFAMWMNIPGKKYDLR